MNTEAIKYLVSRWALIFVVEALAEGRRLLCRREESSTLLTFVNILTFICTHLLSSGQ
jgi:hypothetical protein